VGDSKTPFYFLIAASTANVFLDLLFVGVFRWHTAGAAFATVLSQLLSAVLVIRTLLKTPLPCRIRWKNIGSHKTLLGRIFLLGLPIGLQSSLYPAANMMIQSGINTFGINSIAAWAVCGKLDILIWLIVDSFGAAVSTFVAQNFGARRYDRARSGVRVSMVLSLIPVFIISAVLYLGSGTLGRLFVEDQEVIGECVYLMRFLAPLYFLYIGGEIWCGAIRGTGETFKPMVLTLVTVCGFRMLWILFVFPRRPELIMAIGCYPVSWIASSLVFMVFYRLRMGKITGPERTQGQS
jgi:putative MATE family efflux protein